MSTMPLPRCSFPGCPRIAGHSGCHHPQCYNSDGRSDGCLYGRDE